MQKQGQNNLAVLLVISSLTPSKSGDFSWVKDFSFQTVFLCPQSSLPILLLTVQFGSAMLRLYSLLLFWGSAQSLPSWIYIALTKWQDVPEKTIRLKFCFQVVAVPKGCWMLCTGTTHGPALWVIWASMSFILGEANNTDTFTVSVWTSYYHSHRVIPVGLKLLKLSCETLRIDLQTKEMCKVKVSLSKQSKMWCSPRYFFFFNFCWLFPLSALTCGSRSLPATEWQCFNCFKLLP